MSDFRMSRNINGGAHTSDLRLDSAFAQDGLISIDIDQEYFLMDLDQADALAKELARRVTDERVRRAELERNKTP